MLAPFQERRVHPMSALVLRVGNGARQNREGEGVGKGSWRCVESMFSGTGLCLVCRGRRNANEYDMAVTSFFSLPPFLTHRSLFKEWEGRACTCAEPRVMQHVNKRVNVKPG